MTDKAPEIWDLDYGTSGTLVRLEQDEAKLGNVFIVLVPHDPSILGLVRGKAAVRYPFSTPVESIRHVYPANKELPGVETHRIIVYRGLKDGVMAFIDNSILQENAKMHEQMLQMELQLRQYKQISENAFAGVKKQVAEARQISKTGSEATQQQMPPVIRNFDDL